MKIQINENKSLDPNEVLLTCHKVCPLVDRIRHFVMGLDAVIYGKAESGTQVVRSEDIYYIESNDKKTFLYLKDHVLETPLKLYALEEILNPKAFFRASKYCIINVAQIKTITPELNRNLLLTLKNNAKVTLSRRNIKDFNLLIEME